MAISLFPIFTISGRGFSLSLFHAFVVVFGMLLGARDETLLES